MRLTKRLHFAEEHLELGHYVLLWLAKELQRPPEQLLQEVTRHHQANRLHKGTDCQGLRV